MNITVDPRKPGELKVRRQRQDHKPSDDEIAALAFRLYEEEGRPEGKHMEHWLKAESMIAHEGGQKR